MENKLKRSKKFCVCLLDFFTCFILTLTLFFIGEAINTSLPSYNSQQNNIQQTQDNLTKIVLESKLSYLKEDNYLAQTTDVTYSYIIQRFLFYSTVFQAAWKERSVELYIQS